MGEKIPYVPVEAWALSKAESEPGIQLAGERNTDPIPGTMRLAEGLRMKDVAGQTILFPTGKAVSKIHQAAVLNPEATELVKLMREDFTVDIVVRQAMKIYAADEETLRKDVEKLVDTLIRGGMLIGDGVKERKFSGTTTISGTAVLSGGKVMESRTTGMKYTSEAKDSGEKNREDR